MKLVKSLLLGSAAGLTAVAGAQAADLPVRKAAPVEYVRVCSTYGAGFFYLPGTDTCLKVGGRARFEYYFNEQNGRATSQTGFRGLARVALDARTPTAYGTLRTLVRVDFASRTGSFYSGSQVRLGQGLFGGGVDTFGQAQTNIIVNDAVIQWAGFTVGRTISAFDFYSTAVELIGSSVGSTVYPTNLFSYTATLGNGFSATLSIEDPIFRRNPAYFQTAIGGINGAFNSLSLQSGNFTIGGTPLSFAAAGFNAAGVPVTGYTIDVAQKNNMPDVVGVLRYDGGWGSAQVSAAVHEIRFGQVGAGGIFTLPNAGAGPVVTTVVPTPPDAEYGWAVQGGLKLNVPQIAPGDTLWLQAAYGQGALQYTGLSNWLGYDTPTSGVTNRFTVNSIDAAVDAFGRTHLTESYSGVIAFQHYWRPDLRSGVSLSHGQVIFDSILKSPFGPAGQSGAALSTTSSNLKSYSVTYASGNLIWSPIRDLDIGVEVAYQRIDVRGIVANANKGGVALANGTIGGTGAGTSTDDNIISRVRVQRDF